MVEVTVADVIVRSPKAEPAVWIAEAKARTLHYHYREAVAEGAR